MSNNLQTLLVISTALATLGSVDGALAQQAPDRLDANSDSTIIVTAQKRQQTLIDVAQSVSVLSADTLENQSVNTIADFLNAVPSLQLVQSTPGQGRIILRGVNVFPTQIEEALMATPGLAPHFQIELSKPDRMDQMRVLCECVDATVDDAARQTAAQQLAAQIKETVGISVMIDVGDVNTITRSEGKAVRIIDNRPKG